MKFIILIIAAGLLYMLFKGDQKKRQVDTAEDQEKLKETGELVKDPMCGTYCRADSDIRVREGDKIHVFCSYECRDKFLEQKGFDSEQVKEQVATEEADTDTSDDA